MLLTGATGAIGSEVMKQLMKANVNKLVMLHRGSRRVEAECLEANKGQKDGPFQVIELDFDLPERCESVFKRAMIDHF